MSEKILIDSETLRSTIQAIFEGRGASFATANVVAQSLTEGSLSGIDSHGALQAIRYVEKIEANTLDPNARPTVESLSPASAAVYGNGGFGQLAGFLGVEVATKLARENGVGSVALRDTNHVGRLGEYAERLCEQGMVSLIVSSGGEPGGQVAPFGGFKRRFGTNPIALGIPGREGSDPIVADFATAQVATGKILLAKKTGQRLPEGALLDVHGMPSTDPNDYYAGGAMLPFGGYKGYGLLLFIEVIANLFCGAAPLSCKSEWKVGNPTFITAWSVDHFANRERFDDLLGVLIESVRDSGQPGSVLLPGELEARSRRERLLHGIPMQPEIWNELLALK